MNEEDLKAAEKRGYSKGYAAGRRREGREADDEQVRWLREEFRREVFLAALTGTLQNGTWKNGEHAWRTVPDYCWGAWKFADEAVKGTYFHAPRGSA